MSNLSSKSIMGIAGIILLSFSSPQLSFGQEIVQNIRGVVVDVETKEPLIGANVFTVVEKEMVGAMTDENGSFLIENLPIGRYDLGISYLGYEDKVVPQVLLTSGKEVVLPVELRESVNSINEIVVSGNKQKSGEPVNSMAVVSARSFNIEQTTRYAASTNDPSRLVLSFAGVKGQGDIVNGIMVRGNGSNGVLWRVEGIEVPNPNHFAQEGYGGGAVSILSSAVLSTSDFYTGAFPAEYGNASSAVFDLNLRKGNNEKRETTIQAGFLGLQAATEGPFSKKKRASYLVNYRYSTLSLLDKVGYDIGNTITTYQDLNLKLHFPTKGAGTFSVFAIGGLSSLEIGGEDFGRDKQVKTYDMLATGLSHAYTINSKNHLRTIVSFAANRETTDRVASQPYGRKQQSYDLGASNQYIRLNSELNTKLSAKTSIRTGLIVSHFNFHLNDEWNDGLNTEIVEAEGKTFSLQFYVQRNHRFNEKLSLLTGMHVLYFGLNDNYSIEPRLGLKYEISPMHSINIGAGIHSRMESLAMYMVEHPKRMEALNEDLGFTKALHVVFGYTLVPAPKIKIKAEAYLQYLYEVPIRDKPNSTFSIINLRERYRTQALRNVGKGYNYGLELTIEKIFADNYYILLSQSLFNSKYLAGDGNWYNTRYNANYITSLSAGKDFVFGEKRQHIIGLNTRLLFSGGERIEDFFVPENNFEEQYRNYFRLDLRLSFTRNLKRYSWELSADIQNTTNRFNDSSIPDIKPTGILPVANFKVSF